MRSVLTVVVLAIALALPASERVHAQTNERPPASERSPVVSATGSSSGAPDEAETYIAKQPAGPPPTPRHTGIKALVTGIFTDLKYLPSKENLIWAGTGGGLALAVHPLDDDVNEAWVGNTAVENFFKPGEILGELGTLLGSASVVYALGRINDQPKVSHVGMDLIQSLAISEMLTQALKYTTRRERPDGSGRTSFPSGHAADTFAFATALERHLDWRYSVPAYTFASYVAMSRLPANRHWLSDVVFGASVGIIAGRTVTSHEAAHPYPVAV
ncbi:MAG TPA: phosphatase PAP2 family protein, partial [Vicinamibacterales bacterium]|nr:phosphatase PAP2 family protein [Vicinamibacterales bacterium]